MKSSKSSASKGGLSMVLLLLLNNSSAVQLQQHQSQTFIKQEDVSFAKKLDNQYVDMNNIGSKMSALSLTMLDKKENQSSEGPQENIFMQTELETEQRT